MESVKFQINLQKLLVVLLLVNYQLITIICNDNIALKYLRDIILVMLIISIFYARRNVNSTKFQYIYIVIFFFLLWAAFRTGDLKTSILFLRRYLFPIVFLWCILQERGVSKTQIKELFKFIFNLLTILSLWGIFQAYVLGPEFLMKLGYPTMYSNAYQAVTLKSSFYFGNLGIQRVVSTVSNSNVFALILGCTIIILLLNYKVFLVTTFDRIKLLIIIGAYILTFSRANFLAMLIVVVILAWRYIPRKIYFFIMLLLVICACILMYVVEGEYGIIHKLMGWVIDSMSFQESSAAGRTGIWISAFNKVKESPLGIGFGKTGSWAQTVGAERFWHCENSYLAMALDMGWLGCTTYVCFLMLLMREAKEYKFCGFRRARTIISGFTYFMIAMFFSNHIYDMEAVAYIYFVFGLCIMSLKREKVEIDEIYSSGMFV